MSQFDFLETPFCFVPSGEFFMGSEETSDLAFDDEKPSCTLFLNSYYISQRPITNNQYKAFMLEEGYSNSEFWKEAVKIGFWNAGYLKGRYDKVFRNHPVYFNGIDEFGEYPVTGLSWYEALAFTRWFEKKKFIDDWKVTLPTETEWEKAAKGGTEIPVLPIVCLLCDVPIDQNSVVLKKNPFPMREYPDFEFKKDNLSPYGVFEMSGNIWEWTLSLYRKYSENLFETDNFLNAPSSMKRVLRGGSKAESKRLARCSSRYRGFPIGRSHDSGFRIVLKQPTAER